MVVDEGRGRTRKGGGSIYCWRAGTISGGERTGSKGGGRGRARAPAFCRGRARRRRGRARAASRTSRWSGFDLEGTSSGGGVQGRARAAASLGEEIRLRWNPRIALAPLALFSRVVFLFFLSLGVTEGGNEGGGWERGWGYRSARGWHFPRKFPKEKGQTQVSFDQSPKKLGKHLPYVLFLVCGRTGGFHRSPTRS